jgi:hypothetical protein
MPDGQQVSCFLSDDALVQPPAPYVPPAALVLQGLDVTELDLHAPRVSVSSAFLRFLVGEFARTMTFDANFYREANPDVEGARLAGDVATLHEHFVTTGYFERRQPHDLPFDAFYYASHYEDLARVFSPADSAALHTHFVGHGWQEGRVGVSWQRADADRWVAAVRAGVACASMAGG